MAVEFGVLLDRADLPDAERWSRELQRLDAPLSLGDGCDPRTHSGYIPVTLDGEASGFELLVGPAAAEDLAELELGRFRARDSIATLRFSQELELVAALFAAVALARACDGGLLDPSTSRLRTGDEVLREAREALAALREKQPAQEPKVWTPAQWARRFLELLRTIHPEYARHPTTRGRSIECIRRDPSGLYVSQNCIRVRDTYHHGFALLFSTADWGSSLHVPLLAGGRFDHNFEIWRAFDHDLGWSRSDPRRPASLMSSHKWRKNAEPALTSCFRNAEEHLLPFYRARLAAGGERLAALFACARDLLSALDPSSIDGDVLPDSDEVVTLYADEFHLAASGFAAWDRERRVHCALLARAAELGVDVRRVLAHRGASINLRALDVISPEATLRAVPADLRDPCIVLNNLACFLSVRGELDELVGVARRLAQSRR